MAGPACLTVSTTACLTVLPRQHAYPAGVRCLPDSDLACFGSFAEAVCECLGHRRRVRGQVDPAPEHLCQGRRDAASVPSKSMQGTFKCTASEGLTLSPILACFFRQLVRANANVEAVQAIQAFVHLDKLVACCQRARTEGPVSPGQMRKRRACC